MPLLCKIIYINYFTLDHGAGTVASKEVNSFFAKLIVIRFCSSTRLRFTALIKEASFLVEHCHMSTYKSRLYGMDNIYIYMIS